MRAGRRSEEQYFVPNQRDEFAADIVEDVLRD